MNGDLRLSRVRCDLGWPVFANDTADDPSRWSNAKRQHERSQPGRAAPADVPDVLNVTR